jgi:hypothetical protein
MDLPKAIHPKKCAWLLSGQAQPLAGLPLESAGRVQP